MCLETQHFVLFRIQALYLLRGMTLTLSEQDAMPGGTEYVTTVQEQDIAPVQKLDFAFD